MKKKPLPKAQDGKEKKGKGNIGAMLGIGIPVTGMAAMGANMIKNAVKRRKAAKEEKDKQIQSTTMPKRKLGGVTAKKKYAVGSTTKACPTGYTLVNGNCVDSSGKSIKYPYISEKGAFYPDAQSLVSGCAKNPNNPKCKEMVDKLTPEQKKKIGVQKKKGGTTMMKKKLGGATAKKKMAAGGTSGMSMGTKQCGPGDGNCKEFKSANIFQKLKQKITNNRNSNFSKPKLKRTKVKLRG